MTTRLSYGEPWLGARAPARRIPRESPAAGTGAASFFGPSKSIRTLMRMFDSRLHFSSEGAAKSLRPPDFWACQSLVGVCQSLLPFSSLLPPVSQGGSLFKLLPSLRTASFLPTQTRAGRSPSSSSQHRHLASPASRSSRQLQTITKI